MSKKPSVNHFSDQGYLHVMSNDDDSIFAGIMPLLTTTAICFELNPFGFSERFCFKDPVMALGELIKWRDRQFNDMRPTGWIACRGVSPVMLKNSFELFYGPDYAIETLNAYKSLGSNCYGYDVNCHIMKKIDIDKNRLDHEVAYLRAIGKIL